MPLPEPSPTLSDAYREGLEAAVSAVDSHFCEADIVKEASEAIRALIEKDKTNE